MTWGNAGWVQENGWYRNQAGGGVTPFTWDTATASTGAQFANSNRDFTGTTAANYTASRTSQSVTSGKWWCAFTFVTTASTFQPTTEIGLVDSTFTFSAGNYLGAVSNSAGFLWGNQNSFNSTITVAHAIPTPQNINAGDEVELAADFTAGKMWIFLNGTNLLTIGTPTTDPTNGLNPWLTWTPGGTWYFAGMQQNATGNSLGSNLRLPATPAFSQPSGFGATIINA